MKKPALAKFKNTIVFIYSISSVGISIYNLICTSNPSNCPNDEHRVTNLLKKGST